MKTLLSVLVLFLSACATHYRLPHFEGRFTSRACDRAFNAADSQPAEEQLNRISDLYSLACYKEVISLGSQVRNHYRSKFYQVSGEIAEVLAPEGSFTDYVLESYERTYLSLLISMSYLNLHNEEAAMVELRRAHEEEAAFIYNFGTDPVLSLLQATLWDRFNPSNARPHWKFIAEMKNSDPGFDPLTVKFALARIKEIDQDANQKVNWRVTGIGTLPELEWTSNFLSLKKNSYNITPKVSFPQSCANEDEVLIPTSSWVNKIGGRYRSNYHPMLFAKSLVRLPVAMTYGVLGVSFGIGVGFAGCAALGDGHGGGEACKASLELAGYIIGKSAKVVEYTVKPDLRHWSKVPSAFFVSRLPMGFAPESCLAPDHLVSMKTFYLIE